MALVDLSQRQRGIAELVGAARQLHPVDAHVRMPCSGNGGVDLERAVRQLDAVRVVAEIAIYVGEIAVRGTDVRILRP
jgi:hypothetical protein